MIALEDLELLDGGDLKAVFDQLSREEVVAALWGAHPGLRSRLLRKLSRRHAQPIEQAIRETGKLSFEIFPEAQRRMVAYLCQLSRAGQIAFDVPEDMAA